MFQSFFRKRKIKKYARKLPHDLKTIYGYQKHYSKSQVDAAIKRKKIGNSGGASVTDNCYAYAMYCSPKEFKEIHDKAQENCDYDVMRTDISNTLFNDVSNFSFSTLLVESSSATSNSISGFYDRGSDSGDYGGSSGGGD